MKYSTNWLKNEMSKGQSINFIGFWGEDNLNGEFSNFYLSEFKDTIFNGDAYTFSCSEQYFMYQKAMTFGSMDIALDILELTKDSSGKYVSKNASGKPENTAYGFKKLGRRVKNFKEDVWDSKREQVMLDALTLKFSQNELLKKKLLDTDSSVLVEASPYDAVWGVKLATKDKQNKPLNEWRNVYKWRGQNLLGFCLMEVRDIIKDMDRDKAV